MRVQEIDKILPDERGIIEVVIEGKTRRFVKDKFLAYISEKNIVIPAPRISKHKKLPKRKRGPARPKIIRSRKWERLVQTTRQGFKIIATKDGVDHGPFISIAECESRIKISKSYISKCIKGDKQCKGYSFKKVIADKN